MVRAATVHSSMVAPQWWLRSLLPDKLHRITTLADQRVTRKSKLARVTAAKPAALLGPVGIELARQAFAGYTVDAVNEAIGAEGRAAHERGDLAGVARALRHDQGTTATLVRLFLLGQAVPSTVARSALRPLDIGAAQPLLQVAGDQVRARIEVRPYAVEGGPPWWAVSDFGSDVRSAPLREDHVLGIGAASLLLAQVTMRRPVSRALDLGTGCGVQALHLATHATSVMATDVSDRALRFAATTAALSGQRWDLREGSLFEPLDGETFDTVVANPPFVVSAGSTSTRRYDYRDSGLTGDAFSEQLLRGVAPRLAPDGTASLLANWVLRTDEAWEERLAGWLTGSGCDAWIWQRDVMDPGAYISLWLRDAGERPRTQRWDEQYDAWRDWFDRTGTVAVGMGVVSLRRTDRDAPVVVCEDVPQLLEQPIAESIAGWFDRADWLARHDNAALLGTRLRRSDDVVRVATEVAGPTGWQPVVAQLQQTSAMHWQVEVDDAVSALVAACDGAAPLSLAVSLLGASTDAPTGTLWRALAPVVRDLVARGILEPVVT